MHVYTQFAAGTDYFSEWNDKWERSRKSEKKKRKKEIIYACVRPEKSVKVNMEST